MNLLDKYVSHADSGYIWREVAEETIILTRDEFWIHTLNELGSKIWKLSDGKTTINEIVSKVCEEFEVDRVVAEKDTIKFIQKLLKKSLIVLDERPTRCSMNE